MSAFRRSLYQRIRARLSRSRSRSRLLSRKTFQRHLESVESLEQRLLMASDWQNPIVRLDVSKDGLVVPLDALVIINELNSPTFERQSGILPVRNPEQPPTAYLDTNGDAFLSPQDVLVVINAINDDIEPPAVTVRLDNDSAPFGTRNSDGVTADDVITGTVSDRRGVSLLTASIDGGEPQPVTLAGDGTFRLDLGLSTTGERDGERVVTLVSRDPGGNVSSPMEFRFVLDTQPPNAAELDFAAT